MSTPILVPRDQWGAKHSPGRRKMPRPVAEINVHHSVTLLTGAEAMDAKLDATDDPCADMRTVERVLHQRGLAPGYSWCIHPSGVILEGAGGNVGAHTAGRNSSSYGICFLGNFDRHQPTWVALASAGWLINVLRFSGALVPQLHDITIQGHRDSKATACPGVNLYDLLPAIRYFAGLG